MKHQWKIFILGVVIGFLVGPLFLYWFIMPDLKSCQRTVESLEAQLTESQNQVKNLESQLIEKESYISFLKSQIEKLEAQLSEKENMIKSLSDTISQLQTQITEKQEHRTGVWTPIMKFIGSLEEGMETSTSFFQVNYPEWRVRWEIEGSWEGLVNIKVVSLSQWRRGEVAEPLAEIFTGNASGTLNLNENKDQVYHIEITSYYDNIEKITLIVEVLKT